jgi:nitroreductase
MSTALGIQPQIPFDVTELLRGRRTIHDFTTEEPPRELIEQALDLARWAPNHHLSQPWHFYWVGPETREAIARLNADIVAEGKGAEAGEEKYQRWRNIPGWLVVTCENSDDEMRGREDYAATCCAIHNLSLFLWSQGVGVKWTTGKVTKSPEFYDLLWVDATVETVVGLVWYGYAAEIPVMARKDMSESLIKLP